MKISTVNLFTLYLLRHTFLIIRIYEMEKRIKNNNVRDKIPWSIESIFESLENK